MSTKTKQKPFSAKLSTAAAKPAKSTKHSTKPSAVPSFGKMMLAGMRTADPNNLPETP